jgi:hypothetical protein
VCSVDVGSIGRTTYKLLSCDCVRVASQDPEEELVASNFLTNLFNNNNNNNNKGKRNMLPRNMVWLICVSQISDCDTS